jgi:hypothetical protein
MQRVIPGPVDVEEYEESHHRMTIDEAIKRGMVMWTPKSGWVHEDEFKTMWEMKYG